MMVSAQELRQQIESAKQDISQKKSEIQKAREQVSEVEKSLPTQTKESLRRNGGREAVIRRKQIDRFKGELEQRKSDITQASQTLSEYEKEIKQADTQLSTSERDFANYRSAVSSAQKNIEKYGFIPTSSKQINRLTPEYKSQYDKIVERVQRGELAAFNMAKELSKELGREVKIEEIDKLRVDYNRILAKGQTPVIQGGQIVGIKEQTIRSPPEEIQLPAEALSRIQLTGNTLGREEQSTPSLRSFSPFLGGVTTTSPVSQGTAVTSPATLREIKQIQKAREVGSLNYLSGKAKEGFKEVNTYMMKIREGPLVQDYEKYVVRPLSKNILQPQKDQVSDTITRVSDFLTRTPVLRETPTARAIRAKRIIERLSAEQEVQVGFLGTRRTIKAGELQDGGLFDFSKKVVLGEVEEAFTGIGRLRGIEKPELLGKGVRVGTEVLPYTVPGLFVAEYGVGAIEAASGGPLGGSSNVLEYVQEKPVETAIVGAIGLGVGYKLLKSSRLSETLKPGEIYVDKKYQKFIEPSSRRLELDESTKLVELKVPEKTAQLSVRSSPGEVSLGFTRKSAGTTSLSREQPTGIFSGSITEKFIGTNGKTTTFGGRVTVGRTGQLEVLNIGSNLQKVTYIGQDGRGVVEIVKGGKVVSRAAVEPSLTNLAGGKVSKIKLPPKEYSIGGGQKVVQTNIKIDVKESGKVPEKILKLKSRTGSKVNPSSLKARQTGQLEFITKTNGGTSETVLTSREVIDVAKLGPKVEVLSRPGLTVRRLTSPNIVYGSADDVTRQIDLSLFKGEGKVGKLAKRTQPVMKRIIAEKTGRKIIIETGNEAGLTKAQKLDLSTKANLEKLSAERATRDVIFRETRKTEYLKSLQEESRLAKGDFKASDLKNLKVLNLEAQVPEVSITQIRAPDLKNLKVLNLEAQVPEVSITQIRAPETYLSNIKTPEIPQIASKVKILETTKESSKSLSGLGSLSVLKLSKAQEQTLELKPLQVTIEKQRSEEINSLDVNFKTRQDISTLQDNLFRQETMQRQITQPILDTEKLTRKLQKPVSEQIFERPRPEPRKPEPQKPISRTDFSTSETKTQKTSKQQVKELFEVFTRKGGKDVSVGAAETRVGAKKLLSEELTGSLRASGFVTKGRRKLTFEELGPLGTQFRKSKVDVFRVVQKKGSRLGARKERRDIQLFRGKSGGRDKW